MGYTHYWRMDKALKIAPLQKALIQEVLDDNKSILKGWDGVGAVEFNAKQLAFNGDATKGEDHESFVVDFGKKKDDFCKTARKPYDLAVCKILLVLSLSEGFNFHSDGACDGKLEDGEWPKAVLWFIRKGYTSTLEKKVVPYLNREN